MAITDNYSPPPNALFRFVAVMILFLSVTASGLQVLAGISTWEHPDPNAPVPAPTLFIPAILTLIAGIALSTLLEGIARLVAAQPAEREDHTAAQVNLMMTIAELQNTLPALIGEAVQQAVSQIEAPGDAPAREVLEPNLQPHLERLVKLMEEMKELSMLDDSQRQNKRKFIAQRRKMSRLQEVAVLIQQGSWPQADALLHLLESLHPQDTDVLACRNQLNDARIQIEKTSGLLYDEIKAAVENRQWRTALDGIQLFLDRYGDHPRADKIRKQIRTIQKNAEIEERREQEDRIKELISARRFGEAADLSEALLTRFPDSPQAAYLTDLLPKLREKATEAEGAITQ